jgi:predicted outer membrane lipoprotein
MAGKYEAKDGTFIPSAKVRAWLYGVTLAASPLAVAYGVVTESQAGLWVALGGAVLGVTNALALANTGERK